MEKMTKEQFALRMDEIGLGNPSIDAVEAIAKARGASEMTFHAYVGFVPDTLKTFSARTKEDMAAQIEQAANGREYVARYSAFCSISSQTSAPTED